MATYNGTLDTTTRSITHHGDYTWATAPDWGSYTSWVDYTGDGSPLHYQTDIIDLDSIQDVYVEVRYNATGTIWTTIEYSTSDSSLSSPSYVEQYTSDNTGTGTIQTHTQLDYYEEGYCDQFYPGFRARYIRFNAFVENFTDATTRGIPVLGQFNWEVRTDTIEEKLNNEAVSGDAHGLSFSKIGTVIHMQITAHDQSNKKLVPHIVSKTAGTIRVVDANTFDTAGVSATVDVRAEGIPAGFDVGINGIFKETT